MQYKFPRKREEKKYTRASRVGNIHERVSRKFINANYDKLRRSRELMHVLDVRNTMINNRRKTYNFFRLRRIKKKNDKIEYIFTREDFTNLILCGDLDSRAIKVCEKYSLQRS